MSEKNDELGNDELEQVTGGKAAAVYKPLGPGPDTEFVDGGMFGISYWRRKKTFDFAPSFPPLPRLRT
jgi:hypothetical protein